MTIRELYLGGPPTNNVDRSMFPVSAFSATALEQLVSKPAAHKGAISFGLTRVLDFQHDSALLAYVKLQAGAGTPIVATDKLSICVIPPGMLFLGISVQVIQAAPGALALTPSTRVGGLTFPAIAAGTAGLLQFATPDATVWVTNGFAPPAAAGGTWFNNAPDVLDLTVGTLPAGGIGNLILAVTPIVVSCNINGFPY
jgi:hypothetical protein